MLRNCKKYVVFGMALLLCLAAVMTLWMRSYRGSTDQRGEIFAFILPGRHSLLAFDSLGGRWQMQYQSVGDPNLSIATMIIHDDSQPDAHSISYWLLPDADLSGTGNLGRSSDASTTPPMPKGDRESILNILLQPWPQKHYWTVSPTSYQHGFSFYTGGDWHFRFMRLDPASPAPIHSDGTNILIMTPYWFLATLIAVLLILPLRPLWRTFQNHRLIANRRCLKCHYDLRAHAPGCKCPECGTPIPQSPQSHTETNPT